MCSIFAFQKQDQITTKKDFENFVTYFKKIDKENKTEDIVATTTKNLLYQSLDWAENRGTEDQKLTIKLLEISYLNKLKKDIEVINKAEFLLKSTKVAELKDVVYMLQDLNQAYSRTEQYNNLLNSYTLYHNLLLKHNIPSRKSSKNNRIALAYYRLRNYEKAKKYFIERGKGFIEENDYFGYSSANNDIGLCFFKMNQLDSAKFYFEKAIAILDDKIDFKRAIGFRKVIEENIASIWVEKGNYNKALPILLGEVNFSRKQQDFKRMAHAYHEVANVYYLKHEPKIALKYIDSIFIYLEKDNNPNLKEESLFLKGKTFLKLNLFNKADEVLIAAEKYKDSLELVKLENQYLIAAVKFETEKKELE
ncbi:tetratricopeptide repeat protein [Polaribacter haliotis]|uniref:Tetratricopeptide repeat protein n=1 Tax=Polaribacter haliotis TaxID=1888915 RepID=A0A7L8ABN2_9FLAO|nr:tetratricopeptide repeat protein [Polaribacter haliotis]QOD59381.1 tetratricopeptide repeat protein [Polaribacter haliotis]